MNVWMAAAEAAPFSKTGGLGEVVGSLPKALAGLGCRVTVFAPHWPSAEGAGGAVTSTGVSVEVPIAGETRRAEVLEPTGSASGSGVRVLLLSCPEYFAREGLYGNRAGDYPDNAERFAFFCRAVVEAGRRLAPGPDVVHAHDWHAALLPFFLRAPEHSGGDPAFSGVRTVLTVHNLAFEGLLSGDALPRLGVSAGRFHVGEFEYHGRASLLKGGLVWADAVTTVSPTHAREIQDPASGFGLAGVLRSRPGGVCGILNGIDAEAWSPGADPRIPAAFTARTLCRREENGEALRRELWLRPDAGPVVGMVTRIVEQKGIELLLELADRLPELGLAWAVLGSGDPRYEYALARLARRYPGRVAVRIGYEEALARLIYAGSDFYCMPSRFEPCGLGQLLALRYGSVPVVRRTGGLADTVPDESDRHGVGITFDAYSSEALAGALARARGVAGSRERLLELRRRGMRLDYSWAASARRYAELYRAAAPGEAGSGR